MLARNLAPKLQDDELVSVVPFTCEPPIFGGPKIFPDAASSDTLHYTPKISIFPRILLLSKVKILIEVGVCSIPNLKIWLWKGSGEGQQT